MGAKGAFGCIFWGWSIAKAEFATKSGNYIATDSLQIA